MERFDVSEGSRFAEMVSVAESGSDVEIVRDGAVVARMVGRAEPALPEPESMQEFLSRVRAFHRLLPAELKGGDATAEIRAMRDED